MNKYAKLLRLDKAIAAATATWIGAIIAGASFMPNQDLMLAMISIFFIAAGGSAANDYFDAQSDKLNRPDRPVAAGKIRKGAALGIGTACFAIGIILSYLISFDMLAIAIVATGLITAFSVQLKNTVLIGNLVIAGLAAWAFFFGGVAAGNHTPALPLSLLVFLLCTGREIYKSIDNSLADRRYDEGTAMKLGVTNSRVVANIFLIVAVIFSFVPYMLGLLGMTYLFFVLIADIIFLATTVLPVKYGSKLIIIGIAVAAVAFLAGSVSL